VSPPQRDPLAVRPLAAALFRDALTAVQHGQVPEAAGALMAIDADSLRGIENRLQLLGSSVADLLTPSGSQSR
jgi:hypothetical protein